MGGTSRSLARTAVLMAAGGIALLLLTASVAAENEPPYETPTVVIEYEAEGQGLLIFTVVATTSPDPLTSPFAGSDASTTSGCDADAIVGTEPATNLVLSEIATPGRATASESGSYTIVAISEGYCHYMISTDAGPQILDEARLAQALTRYPEGTEVPITVTVRTYEVGALEPTIDVLSGEVEVNNEGRAPPAGRAIVGTVDLQPPPAGPKPAPGPGDAERAQPPALGSSDAVVDDATLSDAGAESPARDMPSAGEEASGLSAGAVAAVGIGAAALAATAARIARDEPELDPELFPDEEDSEDALRPWWYAQAGLAEEAELPPVYVVTLGWNGRGVPHVPKRVRSRHRALYGNPYLVGMALYDSRAAQRAKAAGLSLTDEWREILATAPEATAEAGRVAPDFVLCGWFPSGRARASFDAIRQKRGLPPLTRKELVAYRRWANRYFSWFRRKARAHPGSTPYGNLSDVGAREFMSGGSRA